MSVTQPIKQNKHGSGPSLRPTDFSQEPPDLSLETLETVVNRFKDTEKKRRLDTEPEEQAEVRWRVRKAPAELLSSLHIVAGHIGVPQSVLTKCMSHQFADWFANTMGITELEQEYNDIYEQIKAQTYSTLRSQAENPAKFRYVGNCEDTKTSISTIQWVVSKVGQMGRFLGMDAGDLLMIGLMWSITTLEHKEWDINTINRFFLPEVFNFETLISDRKVDILALRLKFENRERTDYTGHIYVREKQVDYDKI